VDTHYVDTVSVMPQIDDVALELKCPCGYENFERVIVSRQAGPIVTDFVACVGCKAVYLARLPKPTPPEARPGRNIGAIGPPPPPRTWADDTSAALQRDAAEAAKEPGRHRLWKGKRKSP